MALSEFLVKLEMYSF